MHIVAVNDPESISVTYERSNDELYFRKIAVDKIQYVAVKGKFHGVSIEFTGFETYISIGADFEWRHGEPYTANGNGMFYDYWAGTRADIFLFYDMDKDQGLLSIRVASPPEMQKLLRALIWKSTREKKKGR